MKIPQIQPSGGKVDPLDQKTRPPINIEITLKDENIVNVIYQITISVFINPGKKFCLKFLNITHE